MTNNELQFLVQEISQKDFKVPFKHQATFNSRLRTTGGRYLLETHNIEINSKIVKNYSNSVLIGVIKHELCHYHLHLNHRGYQHRNRDFKILLNQVGGSRYAPATLNSEFKVVYQCVNCRQEYPRRRKINTSYYRCSRCGGKLKQIK